MLNKERTRFSERVRSFVAILKNGEKTIKIFLFEYAFSRIVGAAKSTCFAYFDRKNGLAVILKLNLSKSEKFSRIFSETLTVATIITIEGRRRDRNASFACRILLKILLNITILSEI